MGRVKITKKAVRTRTTNFHSALDRAAELSVRICEDGHTRKVTKKGVSKLAPLLQPDRRDVAELILFEVAAKYEDYARYAFSVEVRSKLSVSASQAGFIMGSADRGISAASGWAVPKLLKERGANLLGTGFHAKLDTHLGTQTYEHLTWAHRVRNRIAHGGGQASNKYVKVLSGAKIPTKERKGMSPGRFLMDYPKNAARNDRWFHRFLAAYRKYGTVAVAHLP